MGASLNVYQKFKDLINQIKSSGTMLHIGLSSRFFMDHITHLIKVHGPFGSFSQITIHHKSKYLLFVSFYFLLLRFSRFEYILDRLNLTIHLQESKK